MTRRMVGVLAILAIVAVVSPAVGAAFDHHMVERMAGHDHVYYGRPDLRHRHGYETPHADARMRPSTAEAPHAVVVLPANSATRDGTAIASVGFTVERAPSATTTPPASLLSSPPDHRPGAVFLPPPYTPPRSIA